MVAKSCSQLSGMLKVWCIQNSHLVTPSLTVGGTRKTGRAKRTIQRVPSLMEQPLLQYENARPCISEKTTAQIETWIYTVLYHPPHSPDMAMSDFHLFPKPKEHLRAHHHMLDDETKTLVKLNSSVIKMHNSNMRDLQST